MTDAQQAQKKHPTTADNNRTLAHAHAHAFYQAKGQQLTIVSSLGGRMAKYSCCVTAMQIIHLISFRLVS